eukprot:TRINITY_DN5048_c0_g1_i1.p1 TRINITY_DN5048_c0_g1~~TRINITY_DN5048_c0_g1_i1.p1  ORF type:complete len:407 (-),score=56.61 TRINITY_DN5048_c0_g1_i1:46-1266(-)
MDEEEDETAEYFTDDAESDTDGMYSDFAPHIPKGMQAEFNTCAGRSRDWFRNHQREMFLAVVCLFMTIVYLLMSQNIFPINDEEDTFVVPPPLVLNTWDYLGPNQDAWAILYEGGTSMDAVEKGINHCELAPQDCNYTVGFGGNPNANDSVTLDAVIMWGPSHQSGAVGDLHSVKRAISVARSVLDETYHSLLVGDAATQFALQVGFKLDDLNTDRSHNQYKGWKANGSIPNYWKTDRNDLKKLDKDVPARPHPPDTIGMLAIDNDGNITCGASSNGLAFRIPGRLGSSSIAGAGAYCDQDIGAGAVATGDGDVILRYSLSFNVVQLIKEGHHPNYACSMALGPIALHYPDAKVVIIAVAKHGTYGGAFIGYDSVPFTLRNKELANSTVFYIDKHLESDVGTDVDS